MDTYENLLFTFLLIKHALNMKRNVSTDLIPDTRSYYDSLG